MSILTQFKSNVAFTDANGRLTKEASLFLQGLFRRVGGSTAPTIEELSVIDDEDSGLEEFKAEQFKAIDGLGMEPPVSFPVTDGDVAPPASFDPFQDPLHPLALAHSEIQQLQTELAGLREEVAVLKTQINDILQGTDL